jgi:hypothetical protein
MALRIVDMSVRLVNNIEAENKTDEIKWIFDHSEGRNSESFPKK